MRFLPPTLIALLAAVLILLASPGDTRAEQPVQLWLPWEGGTLWLYTNGPHGQVGEALDFQPPDAAGKPCEYFHSSFWVVAAADGTVSSVAPNTVQVDHAGGLTTNYYHLENKQVKAGDSVRAGDRLGTPGCCPDGFENGCWATGPHLHFSTIYHDQRQPAAGLNLGGWRVGADGCLNRPGQNVCPLSGRIVSNSPRPGQNSPSTPADLALVIDTSTGADSPGHNDRFDAAMALLQATREDDRVAVVAFDDGAKLRAPLRAAAQDGAINAELVEAAATPDKAGESNVRLGLVSGCAELLANGKSTARAAILISDGHHDRGPFTGAAECFSEYGIPVFAYGVGNANESLLQGLADRTGGEYKHLSYVKNLYCEFLRVRTVLSGDPPGTCDTLQAKTGESLSFPVSIPQAQDQAVLEVRWRERRSGGEEGPDSSPITTQIVGPGGRPLSLPIAGVTRTEEDGAIRYVVARPQPGEWKLIARAETGAPPEGVYITFSAAVIPQVSPFIELPATPQPVEPTFPTLTPFSTPTGSPVDSPTTTPTTAGTPRPTRTLDPAPTPTASQPTRTAAPTATPPPTAEPVISPSPAPQ